MEKLKIAIVDVEVLQIRNICLPLKLRPTRLKWLHSAISFRSALRKRQKEYGVEGAKVYTDYKEMLADTASRSMWYMYVHRTLLTARLQLPHLRPANM